MQPFEAVFSELFSTDEQPIESRPFQIDVARHLLEGKSVILRAPTGSGKTFAAWFPFLYALREGKDFPRQLLYSLPLRVLANHLAETAIKTAQGCIVKIQTGETPNDPQFLLGDMVFATYDQTLSSFLHFPFSLSRKQANVNAGTLVSSYLVFDEIHLMEMHLALGTTAEMLRWLQNTTPFLLMTATLTDGVIEWLCQKTGAVYVELTPEEIETLPRPRTWTYSPVPLTAQAVVKEHTGKTIVVVNQVERAQQLFAEFAALKKRRKLPGTKIMLLHSRFTREDRRSKTEKLDQWFGKKPDNTDCILVATQVIEVGLDISCTRLHTEIAPANALVQRAGRCARFGGAGKVFVYDVQREKQSPYLPYLATLSEATEKALSELCGEPAGYVEELAFVKTVHEEPDRKAMEEFEREARSAQMEEAIRSLSPAYYRELVRDIDAISGIVYDRPNVSVNPFSYEAFSLPVSVLMGAWKRAQDTAPQEVFAWLAKERSADDLYDRTTYEWQPVNTEEEVLLAPRIALNPSFAAYDDRLGLQLNVAGQWQSPLLPQRPLTKRPFYVRETYEEHIRKVWRACGRHFSGKQRLGHAGRRLEQALGMPEGAFDRLLRMVIAFHDTAKMTEGWQDAVNKYQVAVGRKPAGPGEFLAHTDYDSTNEFQREQEKRFPRPPHALEGAVATSAAVATCFVSLPPQLRDVVVKAYLAAMGTHHSSTASTIKEKQRLMSGATQEAARVAREIVGLTLSEDFAKQIRGDIPKRERLNEKFPQPQDQEAFLLYLLLVRALRLSDQHSFEEG